MRGYSSVRTFQQREVRRGLGFLYEFAVSCVAILTVSSWNGRTINRL